MSHGLAKTLQKREIKAFCRYLHRFLLQIALFLLQKINFWSIISACLPPHIPRVTCRNGF